MMIIVLHLSLKLNHRLILFFVKVSGYFWYVIITDFFFRAWQGLDVIARVWGREVILRVYSTIETLLNNSLHSLPLMKTYLAATYCAVSFYGQQADDIFVPNNWVQERVGYIYFEEFVKWWQECVSVEGLVTQWRVQNQMKNQISVLTDNNPSHFARTVFS